jgi:hypothetical protein
MADFGTVAVETAKRWDQNKPANPDELWRSVCREQELTDSMIKKGCPKNTFLGLCEEGLIKNIPPGKYTESKKNKRYGLAAVKILAKNHSLADNPCTLWDAIRAEVPDRCEKCNGQMDVVIALWKENLIKE